MAEEVVVTDAGARFGRNSLRECVDKVNALQITLKIKPD